MLYDIIDFKPNLNKGLNSVPIVIAKFSLEQHIDIAMQLKKCKQINKPKILILYNRQYGDNETHIRLINNDVV